MNYKGIVSYETSTQTQTHNNNLWKW